MTLLIESYYHHLESNLQVYLFYCSTIQIYKNINSANSIVTLYIVLITFTSQFPLFSFISNDFWNDFVVSVITYILICFSSIKKLINAKIKWECWIWMIENFSLSHLTWTFQRGQPNIPKILRMLYAVKHNACFLQRISSIRINNHVWIYLWRQKCTTNELLIFEENIRYFCIWNFYKQLAKWAIGF